MEYFLQQLINGITLGSVYGLIAIGYTMVYGIIGMINFAHGEIYMIGAFTGMIFLVAFSAAPAFAAVLMALVFAMAVTGFYGWTIERVAYRPLRGSFRLAPLISAVGVSIFLQNYVQVSQGARTKAIPEVFSGHFVIFADGDFPINISYVKIFIVLLTLALMVCFSLIITKTSFGRQQRACQQDRLMAALVGVNVDRTISMTFVMGACLAAVAGMMVVLYYGAINFYIGFIAGIKAFTAAVLGGIGSVPGAMLGGLLIGLIEALWAAYFDADYRDVATFGILVLVLIFRPEGIMGKPEIEKV